MKEFKQFGSYGLVIKNDTILLIKKNGGPYDGKLDLPGGTIEFNERPQDTLKREMMEETGIEVESFILFDADSVSFEWQFKDDLLFKVHHMGIFYRIDKYKNEVKSQIKINEENDDSIGACFYNISELKKDDVSRIVILELEKLGYNLK